MIPLPTDSKARKEIPVTTGVFDYFPNALAEVARISFFGNQKHNPGQPLHWSRGKSNDHPDCIGRHLLERGTKDENGQRHSAMLAWRALANLQIELEEENKNRLDQEAILAGDLADEVLVDILENGTVVEIPQTMPVEGSIIIGGEGFNFVEVKHPDLELLATLSCKPEVATQIVAGSSYTDNEMVADRFVYVAGPMRGYDKFNFPAFDATRDVLLRKGWNVISPADIDRAAGCNEDTPPAAVMDQRVFVYRDFYALFFNAHQEGKGNGAIAMLPGWEKSTGAAAEFFMARWLGLKVLNSDGNLMHPSSINYIDLNAAVEKFLLSQWEN